MRHVLIVIGLFLIPFFCFSQQNTPLCYCSAQNISFCYCSEQNTSFYSFSQQDIPSRIIGGIPSNESTRTYEIQVGSFRNTQNANNAVLRLRSIGLNAVYESYSGLTRVLITNISARQVRDCLVRIKSIGFDEVIIREDRNYTVAAGTTGTREGITEDIQNLIPLDTMKKIEELGIEINAGRNPPNIEGTYLVSTLQLVRSTSGRDIATQWDKYVTFSSQNNTSLTINADYTMQTETSSSPMTSRGPGSFIIGEGNKFTVVVDGTREQGGYTAKTVEIFSGEISEAGIRNYYWAVMMLDNNGDPLGIWIENNTGYTKRDSDGFSERVR